MELPPGTPLYAWRQSNGLKAERGSGAEADRLSGIYIRITMLVRAQRIDLLQAGRDAVAKGWSARLTGHWCARPSSGGRCALPESTRLQRGWSV
jgi:hypothetical protein